MDADGRTRGGRRNNAVEESEPELSPDNSQVLLHRRHERAVRAVLQHDLFVVPARRHAARACCPNFPTAVDRATWAPDGRSILAVVNMGVHSEIFGSTSRPSAARQLTDGDHSIPLPTLEPRAGGRPDGLPVRRADAVRRRLDAPPRDAPRAADARHRRLRRARARLSRCRGRRRSTWKGADGATIEGLLFYPIDYAAGHAVPAGRAAARRTGRVRQVRLRARADPQLRAGADRARATRCCGRTTAAAPATATRSIATSSAATSSNMHLDVLAGVDALDQAGHRRSRRAGGDGLERRRAPRRTS